MVNYAPLTEEQARYIERSADCWMNVAEGGKRAGKNIINLIIWAMILEDHPDTLHLAGGVSIATVRLNIIDSNGFGLKHIFAGRCRECQYDGRDALRIETRTGTKYILISGGSDKAAAPKIKGNSYGTVYITEANECHETFIKEAIDRTLSSSDRKIIFDLNPKAPMHWFYEQIIDHYAREFKAGRMPGYNYAHFTIQDNLSLTPDQYREALISYNPDTIWYQRDILGLRTTASGRIYIPYKYDDIKITKKQIQELHFAELTVGIDVGGTDAVVATLQGVTMGFRDLCMIDGLYHKQGMDTKIDEATYVRMVCDWLAPWDKTYQRNGTIYVDSANKLFKIALNNELIRRRMSRWIVKSFDKSDGILERIQLFITLMVQGRLRVAEHLTQWHQAFQMATWEPEEYADGEWVRVDDGSYPLDTLDSAEYGAYDFKRYLIK